eukprot:1820837-Prymnesium_polylepis.1
MRGLLGSGPSPATLLPHSVSKPNPGRGTRHDNGTRKPDANADESNPPPPPVSGLWPTMIWPMAYGAP